LMLQKFDLICMIVNIYNAYMYLSLKEVWWTVVVV
jgi:hypothetical protein